MSLALFSSCKEEKKSDDIIVEKVVDKVQQGTEKMANESHNGNVQWIGGQSYSYTIKRESSQSLPKVMNHDVEYYDNYITLTVRRSDGTVFFEKKFSKSNFSPVLPEDFNESGVMLGMTYHKTEGNDLYFLVSVGSPDENIEEFYYVLLELNNFGNTSAKKYVSQ